MDAAPLAPVPVDATTTVVAWNTTKVHLLPPAMDAGTQGWEGIDGKLCCRSKCSEGITSRKRKSQDIAAMTRSVEGKKPNQVCMKVGREIDGGCEVKNVWDNAVSTLVPRLLDISIISLEKLKLEFIQKLKDALNEEFKYANNHMNLRGFHNAIKKFLKMEKSRLKSKFVAGQTQCPIYIQPLQWEAQKAY
jgi:hypothetical protein